jgi:hypothetical protein
MATKKKKKTRSTTIVKQPTRIAEGAKLRKKPEYKSFKFTKRIKHHQGPLLGWWKIFRKALRLVRANKKNVFFFSIIYGLLSLVLVRGLTSPVDISGVRDAFDGAFAAEVTDLATKFTALGLLFESTTRGAGEVSSLYQSILFVMGMLALIWLYRQQQAGNKVTIRQAFYRGMYPMVPFILVLVVMTVQLLPMLIGKFLYDEVVGGGIAVGAFEETLWLLLFIGLIIYSLYMISASVVALYVVTLPEMTPLMALRKAKDLVTFRRFSVLLRFIVYPLFAILFLVLTVLPMLFIAEGFAQWLFFIELAVLLPVSVAYYYVLYRELL